MGNRVAAQSTRRAWCRRHARSLALLAYVSISVIWFAGAWVDPVHRHAGISGDPDSYLFALSWPPYAVAHHMNPFYTTYLLAPRGANLMWTIPPGFGVLLWPLTASVGLVLTYNLLATLSLAFSAWTAQLALRRFVPGELGPIVGGLFYGFSPYMAAHSLAHVMLTVAILPPLLLLLVHEALIRQRWRPTLTGLAIGALMAFQISTFLEMLAGAAIAAALVVALLAVVYRDQIRERFRYVAIAAAIAVVSFLLLASAQLWTLFFGSESLLHVHELIHPPNLGVTDLFGFVLPSKYNAIAPGFLRGISNRFSTGDAEINGYVGIPLLIVCSVIVAKHWRSATVRITTIVTVTMGMLSTGPRLQVAGTKTIPMPWSLIARLPLMGNLLPVRLSVFTDLGIALLLAYGIGHRVASPTPRQLRWRVIAAVAVVSTLLPSLFLLRQISAPVRVPSFFTSSRVKEIPDGSIALIAPWTTDPGNTAPEVWQAFAHFRFRLASGYAYVPIDHGGVSSGRFQDPLESALWQMGHGTPAPDLANPAIRAQMRGLLHQHRIATVIVGPMDFQEPMLRFMTTLIGRPPERVGGVYLWSRVGG